MGNSGKIALSIFGFLICAFLGYFGAEKISKIVDRSGMPTSISGGGSPTISSHSSTDGDIIPGESQPVQAAPPIESSPSKPQASSKPDNPTGHLPSQLPGSDLNDPNGNARNDKVTNQDPKPSVRKVTSAELEQVLNSGDSDIAINADFKNRIAANCVYVFLGRNEEEGDAPISYNEIINRVRRRTWSSVTVQSVSYFENGKMSKAVIQVNY